MLHGIGTEGKFFWRIEEGRYFLDGKTFDRITAGLTSVQYGYTDLILTAEAIKHGAWKLLSRRGLKHIPDFLRDFPDSRERYRRAIWDSHTSLYAKRKGMTVNEFLRMRRIGLT